MEMQTPEPVTNNELASMEETQPIYSDMQIDIFEPQSFDTEPHPVEETQPVRRRKKKSMVWEHFTIENVGGNCRRAYCNQCKQSFAYSTGNKVAGTSHLKRHIAKGTCPVVLRNQENALTSPNSAPPKMITFSDTPKRRYRTAGAPLVPFDADRCRHEIAKMMIMQDYQLHMVEHPGFLSFVQSLQPRFDMVSFNTVQGDCVATYLKEKQSIQKVIEKIPGRVSLTLDLWSSSYSVGYMFVSGQFIDSEWKMHRKLLSVIMEPNPDTDTAFSHSVAACLSDWSMDRKLFSVTVNQQLTEGAVDNLRALLSVNNASVLNGQLLISNCLARSLSGIVQVALSSVDGIVQKVRDSVKYVKTSESREEKFLELKHTLQVPSTKSLSIDDQTKWNTTYEMLLAASELKEVFSCLDASDPDYKDAPSGEDWQQINTLCTYLKPLFDTAKLLLMPGTRTTDIFFHEAWKIQLELSRAASGEDPFLSNLTKVMQEKFDEYWKSCCYILAIAVVMDPRFKMKLVEFSFSKIYGDESPKYVKIVNEGIHELFLEYSKVAYDEEEASKAAMKLENPEGDSNGGGGLMDFDAYMMETKSQESKTELDQYLEESLLPRVHEFDVVGWWKLNRTKYPTLSKMARDVLSIPVCTVAAEAVFDTKRKEMDSYRCSLRPETVEALICAKDWLYLGNDDDKGASGPTSAKMEVPI